MYGGGQNGKPFWTVIVRSESPEMKLAKRGTETY